MPNKRWTLPNVLIISIGLLILIGWSANVLPILVPYSSLLSITLFSGIAFILIAIGLFLYQFALAPRLQVTLGVIIMLLVISLFTGGAFLPQAVSHFIFPENPIPGAAISFFLCGLIFCALPFMRIKAIAIFVEILIYLILFAGLLGLLTHFFNLKFLYFWFVYSRMSLLASVGLIIIGVCFWKIWKDDSRAIYVQQGREDKQIILVSSILIILIAMLTSITSFLEIADYQVTFISQMFKGLVEREKNLIMDDFNQPFSEIKSIQKTEFFQKEVFRQDNPKLNFLLHLFIDEGFTAVSFYDVKGKLIHSEGRFTQNPDMNIILKLPSSNLLWKEGWFIRVKTPVNFDQTSYGFIISEWPLNDLGKNIAKGFDLDKTTEIVLCAPKGEDQADCFPSRLTPHVHTMGLRYKDQTLPIKHAFQNQSGVMTAYDYRHQPVLAAYSPLEKVGLGIVLKTDLKEIYAPIITNLKMMLPLIALIMLIGIFFLRTTINPLVKKLIKAEGKMLKTNKLLKQEQERYNLAVVGSQVGLWDWAVGSDAVYYSPYFVKMLGYEDREWPPLMETFKQHLHPEDLDAVFQKIDEHLAGKGPYVIDYRLQTKFDGYRWFQAVGQAKQDEKGVQRMSGSIRDITELKVAHQRQASLYLITKLLSEADQLDEAAPMILRAICEGMRWDCGIIWIADYQRKILEPINGWRSPSSQLESFLSDAKNRVFAPNEGLPGKVWVDAKALWIEHIDHRNLPRQMQFKQHHIQTGFCFPILLGYNVLGVMEFFSIEAKPSNPDLIKMMTAIGPQVGQFIQKKSFEDELRKSETQKRAILEATADSIITINPKGDIISWNTPTEKMFQYAAQELHGKNINQLMPEFSKNIVSLMKGKIFIESIAIKKDKVIFYAEISVSEITLEKQHHFVVIVHDISERRKAQSLKDEFISVVSHELRTPLTSIRGSLGLILGGAVGTFTDKAKSLLAIANNNCERLLLLINDILDIEKIEAGKMVFKLEEININDIVQKSIEVNLPFAEKYQVKLALTTKAQGILVRVDPDRLIQVLTNLISNAVKFSPAEEKVSITITKNGKFVRVCVSDKGSGVPEEFKKRIFQKFTQADSSNTRGKGGTGLGLSISKIIVEKLKGKIHFKSEPHQGAEFYFDLPIYYKETQHVDEPVEEGGFQLLICEDDEDQANYLCGLLNSSGYKTVIAHNAQQAKDHLFNEHYDALLLDLILPDQDGIALIRELRANPRTRTLPIIVTSIICDTGRALLNGEALSILDWLDKPLDMSKLSGIIKLIKKNQSEKKYRILHIEDDVAIQKIVSELLIYDCEVTEAETLLIAREKLAQQEFDLVILDLLLPDGNGIELLPQLAQKGLPVLVFSSVELDEAHAKYTKEVLIKSKTTYPQLLTLIQKNIKHDK